MTKAISVADMHRRIGKLKRAIELMQTALDQADADARCYYNNLAKREMPE